MLHLVYVIETALVLTSKANSVIKKIDGGLEFDQTVLFLNIYNQSTVITL